MSLLNLLENVAEISIPYIQINIILQKFEKKKNYEIL